MATSTLLTLVVVSAIFTYIDALQEWLSQGVLRRAHDRQLEVEEPEEVLRH